MKNLTLKQAVQQGLDIKELLNLKEVNGKYYLKNKESDRKMTVYNDMEVPTFLTKDYKDYSLYVKKMGGNPTPEDYNSAVEYFESKSSIKMNIQLLANNKKGENKMKEITKLETNWETKTNSRVDELSYTKTPKVSTSTLYYLGRPGNPSVQGFKNIYSLIKHYGLHNQESTEEANGIEVTESTVKSLKYFIKKTKQNKKLCDSLGLNIDGCVVDREYSTKVLSITFDYAKELVERNVLVQRPISKINFAALVRLGLKFRDKLDKLTSDGLAYNKALDILKTDEEFNVTNDSLEELCKIDFTVSEELFKQKLQYEQVENKEWNENNVYYDHTQLMSTNGALVSIYDAIYRKGMNELEDVSMGYLDLSKVAKKESWRATYPKFKGGYSEDSTRIEDTMITSMRVIKPSLDENGKYYDEVVVKAEQFVDFMNCIRFDGKEVFYALQTSSQLRTKKGTYFLAGDLSTAEKYADIFSNGFYEEHIKGKFITMGDAKRMGQNASSSNTLFSKEEFEDFGFEIIANPTLYVQFESNTPNQKDGSLINGKLVTEELVVGDGMGCATFNVLCLMAKNRQEITPIEYRKLQSIEFDLTFENHKPNRELKSIIKKLAFLRQTRPVKGTVIGVPKHVMMRWLTTYHGLSEKEAKGKDFILTASMAKGGISFDSLYELAKSCKAIDKGQVEGCGKINAAFARSLSASVFADDAVDTLTKLIEKQMNDIFNEYFLNNNISDIMHDAGECNRKASAIKMSGINTDPRSMITEIREGIDNLLKKGLSVPVPGTQYCFIINDVYAVFTKLNEFAIPTEMKIVDKYIDKNNKEHNVYEIKSNPVTRRGGKVTILRNPHSSYTSFFSCESHKASEIFIGEKSWMKLLMDQNIVMLPIDTTVFVIDGADFDGDEVWLAYADEYPAFYMTKDELLPLLDKYFYATYVENGAGRYSLKEKIKCSEEGVTLKDLSNGVLSSFGEISYIGKISNRTDALNEAIFILYYKIVEATNEFRSKDKGTKERKIAHDKCKSLIAEYEAVVRKAVQGDMLKQASVDMKLGKNVYDSFMNNTKNVVIDEEERNITRVEYINGLGYAGEGLTLLECKSVTARVYKNATALSMILFEKLAAKFKVTLQRIMTTDAEYRLNIFDEDVCSVLNLPRIDEFNENNTSIKNEYNIVRMFNREYNMRARAIKNIFSGDGIESDDKEQQTAFKELSDEIAEALGEKASDPTFAYMSLAFSINKMYRQYKELFDVIDDNDVFNMSDEDLANFADTDLFMSKEEIDVMNEFAKKYKMENVPGKVVSNGKARYINYRNLLNKSIKGTSFTYSVLTKGLLSICPILKLKAPKDAIKVIVSNNKMLVSYENRPSSLPGFNLTISRNTEEGKIEESLISLRDDKYNVTDGYVKIAKDINVSDYSFKADRPIDDGKYTVVFTDYVTLINNDTKERYFITDKLVMKLLDRVLYAKAMSKKLNGRKAYVTNIVNNSIGRFNIVSITKNIKEESNKIAENKNRIEQEKVKVSFEIKAKIKEEVEKANSNNTKEFLDEQLVERFFEIEEERQIELMKENAKVTITKKQDKETRKDLDNTINLNLGDSRQLVNDIDVSNEIKLLDNQVLFNSVALVLNKANVNISSNDELKSSLSDSLKDIQVINTVGDSDIALAIKSVSTELKKENKKATAALMSELLKQVICELLNRSVANNVFDDIEKFDLELEDEYMDAMLDTLELI